MPLFAPRSRDPRIRSNRVSAPGARVAALRRSTRIANWAAVLGLAFAAFVVFPSPVPGSGGPPSDVTVEDARVVMLPRRRDRWAAYLTLCNNGQAPVRLLGAETPLAARVEILEAATEAPAAPDRPREGGLVIPPGGSVVLGPGALYLALIDPATILRGGDRFPLTLRFADGGELTVVVSVDAVGGAPLHEGPLVVPPETPRP